MGTYTIGIVGGMGPEASMDLYRRLLRAWQRERGAVQDSEYPEIIVHSVSFDGTDESGIADKQRVREQLREALDSLDGRADTILVPCVTLHALLDHWDRPTDEALVHVVDETMSRLGTDGQTAVGLLASETTYRYNSFRKRANDLSVLVPDARERKDLSDIIHSVMGGERTPTDQQRLQEIANSLDQRGAEAIIVGCTELSVLVGSDGLTQDTYDTVEVLIDTALGRAQVSHPP